MVHYYGEKNQCFCKNVEKNDKNDDFFIFLKKLVTKCNKTTMLIVIGD